MKLNHISSWDFDGMNEFQLWSGLIRIRDTAVLFGPDHAKMCLMSYANNKGADQPAHLVSQISTFVDCCLDSIMLLVSISEISRL